MITAFVNPRPPRCHLDIVTSLPGHSIYCLFRVLPPSVQTDRHRRLDSQLLYFGLDLDFYNAQSPYLDTLGPGVRLLSPSASSSIQDFGTSLIAGSITVKNELDI
jgi:hypothetical protein